MIGLTMIKEESLLYGQLVIKIHWKTTVVPVCSHRLEAFKDGRCVNCLQRLNKDSHQVVTYDFYEP